MIKILATLSFALLLAACNATAPKTCSPGALADYNCGRNTAEGSRPAKAEPPAKPDAPKPDKPSKPDAPKPDKPSKGDKGHKGPKK